MRTLIAIVKIFWFAILCLLTFPTLAIWNVFFSHSRFHHVISKTFHKLTCEIFGVKKIIIGNISQNQTVYVGNHLSYIDIPLLGSFLNATFISKIEVKSWPVLGQLALLADTIFIRRDRESASQCIEDIQKRILKNRSLILFPEGTSSNGASIIPFKSSLFELFLSEKIKDSLIVQPFTIIPQTIHGKGVSSINDHDGYAWYGDMSLAPHLWMLAKSKGVEIKIIFHEPHKASTFNNRKAFSNTCYADSFKGLKDNSPLPLDSP